MTVSSSAQITWQPTAASVEQSFDLHAGSCPVGTYPSMGGVALVDLHRTFLGSRNSAWKDTVLLELISAAQDGDALAHLAVIRLTLPKAIQLAVRSRELRLHSMADAISIYVTAMWEAVLSHPAHWTKSVAFSLGMTALNIINGPVKRGNRSISEEAFDAYSEEELDGRIRSDEVTDPDQDLAEVLSWALSAGVLSREDIILLTRYYLAGDVQASRDALCASHGINAEALRKRASRLRASLVQAVRAEVTQSGW